MNEQRLRDERFYPSDFSDDEKVFAQELRAHFDIENESLPPLYTRTLLGRPEESLPDDGLEDRIRQRVFMTLQLQVPDDQRAIGESVVSNDEESAISRRFQQWRMRLVVGLVAIVAIIAMNPLTSAAAFAHVVQMIVGNGGVRLVREYPEVSTKPAPVVQETDHVIRLSTLWPGQTIGNYTFDRMEVYDSHWWTKGAVVMIRYAQTTASGIHHLTLLEFSPRDQIALQVVQDGAAKSVPIGTDGANGVFVTGHWVHHGAGMAWSADDRAELICQGISNDGTVVWIAADNVDNAPVDQLQTQLVNIAQNLQPLHLSNLPPSLDSIQYMGSGVNNPMGGPFENDIVALGATNAARESATTYLKISPTTDATAGQNP